MNRLSEAVTKLAAVLESKGFDKEAAELETVAAWMPQQRYQPPKAEHPESVEPSKTPFIEKGKVEVVDDLSAPGKKKVMSGKNLSSDEVRKLENLVSMVDFYNNTEGFLKPKIWDRIQELLSEGVKSQVSPELRKLTPQEERRRKLLLNMARSASEKLAAMGYESMALRVQQNAFRILESTIWSF